MPSAFAQALLDAHAVQLKPESPFTWASGLKSPIYCDNRQLLGHADHRAQIADELAKRAKGLDPQLVAGTSTAGIPWAALVADRLKLPMAYVRPEPKRHGLGRQVEGPSVEGLRVLLLEDLVSTGTSSLRCVSALREEGAQVLQLLAIFSYGLPHAHRAFADAQLPFTSLVDLEDLLAAAMRSGDLTEEQLPLLRAWCADPGSWSSQRGGIRI